ncbi:hypothetical protein J6590_067532 [Homalodisca vitripennis]|nr:hypothetical protein J6590_067532 [Homalodisca vitripennis]
MHNCSGANLRIPHIAPPPPPPTLHHDNLLLCLFLCPSTWNPTRANPFFTYSYYLVGESLQSLDSIHLTYVLLPQQDSSNNCWKNIDCMRRILTNSGTRLLICSDLSAYQESVGQDDVIRKSRCQIGRREF